MKDVLVFVTISVLKIKGAPRKVPDAGAVPKSKASAREALLFIMVCTATAKLRVASFLG
jgi:hypothetical protein